MSTNKKRQLFGLLLIIGLLMVVLAVSLPGLRMQLGQDLYARQDAAQDTGVSESEPDYTSWERFMQVFSTIATILLFIYIVVSLFSKEGRKRLLGMVAVFLLLVLMMLIFSNVLSPMDPPEEMPAPQEVETQIKETEVVTGTPVEFDPEPKSWLLVVMIVAGAVLLAGVVFSFVNKIPKQSARDTSQFEELAEKAQSALDDIEADMSDFDDIIIRCYAEMSYALQTQTGIQRAKAMTTFEFEQELIRFGFPAQPVQQLTRLFEQVRYGHQKSGETEKHIAVESLGEIVEFCKVYA